MMIMNVIEHHESVQVEIFLEHFGHLVVHLSLQLLHVAHLDVTLQFRQDDLCFGLRFASLGYYFCFYVFLELALEIVVIL